MIDATAFPDAEAVLIAAIQAVKGDDFCASNETEAPIVVPSVIVGFAGGGSRDWAQAATNVGINVYAADDDACRELVLEVQNILAGTSNDEIESVTTPAGGATSVERQSPPFQRYFVVTVRLRPLSLVEDLDLS